MKTKRLFHFRPEYFLTPVFVLIMCKLLRSSERYLQSLVGVLCALCPVGDSRDTSSTSEVGRRLGDVGIVALPVLCPGLARLQQVTTEPYHCRSVYLQCEQPRSSEINCMKLLQKVTPFSEYKHPYVLLIGALYCFIAINRSPALFK